VRAEAADRVVVEFDRALDPAQIKGWAAAAKIERGKWVRAGDRFEGIRPGYDVVNLMMSDPRFEVVVSGAELSGDFRKLMLTTEPQHRAGDHFALTLPGYDLHHDLSGAEVEWRSTDGSEVERGWVPFIDSEALINLGPPYQQLLRPRDRDGVFTVRGQLDLTHMLQPAVQPGATLDFAYPQETVSVYASSKTQEFQLRAGGQEIISKKGQVAHDGSFSVKPKPGSLERFEWQLKMTGGSAPNFSVGWHTAADERLRPFAKRRVLMPFVQPASETAAGELATTKIQAKVTGGNWARGREVFFSEEALCSKCHQVRGQGVHLGPDLSNMVARDAATLLRDLHEPGATLNPDYLAYEIEKPDGSKLVGVPRLQADGSWLLGIGAGAVVPVAKADVKTMKPIAVSLMPAGLDVALGEERLRDLMTYLLVEPPLMGEYAPLPKDGVSKAPPRRTPADLTAALAGAPDKQGAGRPLRMVLVAGEKDHGVGEHDYPRWQKVWGRLIAMASHTEVETAWEWPSAGQWAAADAIVFFRKGDWSDERARDVDAFLNRSGGLSFLHWAIEGGAQASALSRRIGLASHAGPSKYRHGLLDLTFNSTANHPIARNFSAVRFHDESYWDLVGDPADVTVLASGHEEGVARPLFWTAERGTSAKRGRVFVSVPGHYSWTFDDPLFRLLVLRGIAWTTGESVDRFNDLIGAGIEPE